MPFQPTNSFTELCFSRDNLRSWHFCFIQQKEPSCRSSQVGHLPTLKLLLNLLLHCVTRRSWTLSLGRATSCAAWSFHAAQTPLQVLDSGHKVITMVLMTWISHFLDLFPQYPWHFWKLNLYFNLEHRIFCLNIILLFYKSLKMWLYIDENNGNET